MVGGRRGGEKAVNIHSYTLYTDESKIKNLIKANFVKNTALKNITYDPFQFMTLNRKHKRSQEKPQEKHLARRLKKKPQLHLSGKSLIHTDLFNTVGYLTGVGTEV